MGPKELRGRLLVVLGASGIVSAATLAACGSSSTPTADAGAESGADANEASTPPFPPPLNPPPPLGDSGSDTDGPPPSPRRPFVVGASLRSARPQARDDWMTDVPSVAMTDAVTRKRLATAWLDDALKEHASVAAFSRFAMQLLGVGAPADLVQSALRASLDEIAHAKACFALARRYGAAECGPSSLAIHDALDEVDLAALVALNVEEGCIGETLGVLIAEEQRARATDPHVRAILKRVVRDEARHADLGWRFVAWAIGQDPRLREVALAEAARAIEKARAMPIRASDADPALWAAHGRVTCMEARAIVERGIREVIHPCLAAIAPPACYDVEACVQEARSS